MRFLREIPKAVRFGALALVVMAGGAFGGFVATSGGNQRPTVQLAQGASTTSPTTTAPSTTASPTTVPAAPTTTAPAAPAASADTASAAPAPATSSTATTAPASTTTTTAPVTVPNVVGEQELAAESQLRTLGLVPFESCQNETTTAPDIYTESPSGGSQVAPGSTITLCNNPA